MYALRARRAILTFVVGLVAAVAACAEDAIPPYQPVRLEAMYTPPTTLFDFLDTVPGVPAVRALDASDRPVADVRVVFVVFRPPFIAAPVVVLTGADGVAELTVPWVMGSRVGAQRIVAFAPNGMEGDAVEFTASLQPGPATSMAIALSGFTLILDVGDSASATLSYRDSVGNLTSAPATAAFQSTDASVATVSSSGIVVAAGHGTAFIVASNAGLSDSIPVSVRNPNPPGFTMSTVAANSANPLAAAPGGVLFQGSFTDGLLIRRELATQSTTQVLMPTTLLDLSYVASGDEIWASTLYQTVIFRRAASNLATLADVPVPHPFLRMKASAAAGAVFGTGYGGRVSRVALSDYSVVSRQLASGDMNGLAVAANGSAVFASRFSPALIMKFNATTLVPTDSAKFSGTVQAVDVHPLGLNLFAATDGQFRVHRASNLALVTTLPLIVDAYDVKAAPEGDAIFITRYDPGRVWVIDPFTFQVLFDQVASFPRRIQVDAATGDAWISTASGQLIRLTRQ